MKPTLGRIVRYVDGNHQEWPAIITVVHSDTLVDLQVFRQVDIIPATSVPFIEKDAELTHCWHWPDRS